MFDPTKPDEPTSEPAAEQAPAEAPEQTLDEAVEQSSPHVVDDEIADSADAESSEDDRSTDDANADANADADAVTEPEPEPVAEPEAEPEPDADPEAASEAAPGAEPAQEPAADETAVRPVVLVPEAVEAPEGDAPHEDRADDAPVDDAPADDSVPAVEATNVAAIAAVAATTAGTSTAPIAERATAEPATAEPVTQPAQAEASAFSTETDRPRRRGRKAVLWTLASAVVLGGGYAALHQVAAGRVPQGTTVAGTDIGGVTGDEAWTTLESAFADRATAPITISVDGESSDIDPSAAGFAFDHDATLSRAGVSDSWAPSTIIDYFTGGQQVSPVVTVDPDQLSMLLDRVDADHGTTVREGRVRFEGAEIVTVEPRAGKVVDRAEAEATLRAAFVSTDRAAELAVLPTEPEIDADDVAKAVEEFANPAVSDAVTLTSGDVEVVLQPSEYTAALKLDPRAGELQPALRPKKLTALVDAALEGNGGPQEATVELVNGTPTVVPDVLGIAFEEASLQNVFLDVVTRPAGERSVEVASVEVRSDFTTEDAKALNIVEEVSSFTTRFPAAAYRFTNIGRAAELINGTVLKPGEVFSLNETVGERTAANGFTTGIMIADGVFKEDFGGGVSQMATTLFNGMFFAGLEDVEHKPHSFYISRYPEGREATVAWGSIDLRFRNNTDHGILIKSSVTPAGGEGLVNVTMYSTKVWDITTSKSGRYAFTSPGTRTMSGDSCQPNAGSGGFDVDVKRYFHKPGESAVVKTENFHTTYRPADRVICE